MKLLPEIEKVIKDKLGQNESDSEIIQAFENDLSSLDTLKIQNYDHKYDLTTERYDAFRELLTRHMPEYLDSKTIYDHQREQNQDDKFELIEIDENEHKNELHKSRAGMPIGDIL